MWHKAVKPPTEALIETAGLTLCVCLSYCIGLWLF